MANKNYDDTINAINNIRTNAYTNMLNKQTNANNAYSSAVKTAGEEAAKRVDAYKAKSEKRKDKIIEKAKKEYNQYVDDKTTQTAQLVGFNAYANRITAADRALNDGIKSSLLAYGKLKANGELAAAEREKKNAENLIAIQKQAYESSRDLGDFETSSDMSERKFAEQQKQNAISNSYSDRRYNISVNAANKAAAKAKATAQAKAKAEADAYALAESETQTTQTPAVDNRYTLKEKQTLGNVGTGSYKTAEQIAAEKAYAASGNDIAAEKTWKRANPESTKTQQYDWITFLETGERATPTTSDELKKKVDTQILIAQTNKSTATNGINTGVNVSVFTKPKTTATQTPDYTPFKDASTKHYANGMTQTEYNVAINPEYSPLIKGNVAETNTFKAMFDDNLSDSEKKVVYNNYVNTVNEFADKYIKNINKIMAEKDISSQSLALDKNDVVANGITEDGKLRAEYGSTELGKLRAALKTKFGMSDEKADEYIANNERAVSAKVDFEASENNRSLAGIDFSDAGKLESNFNSLFPQVTYFINFALQEDESLNGKFINNSSYKYTHDLRIKQADEYLTAIDMMLKANPESEASEVLNAYRETLEQIKKGADAHLQFSKQYKTQEAYDAAIAYAQSDEAKTANMSDDELAAAIAAQEQKVEKEAYGSRHGAVSATTDTGASKALLDLYKSEQYDRTIVNPYKALTDDKKALVDELANLIDATQYAKPGNTNGYYSNVQKINEILLQLGVYDDELGRASYQKIKETPTALYDNILFTNDILKLVAGSKLYNKRKEYAESQQGLKEWMSESAFNTILANGLAVGAMFLQPFDALYAIRDGINPQEPTVNGYAPSTTYMDMPYTAYRDSVRANTGEQINNTIGNFFYGVGTSMIDMLVSLPLNSVVPGASLALLGTSAGTSAAREASERGLDNAHALLTGVLAGAAEAFFEKFSLESLKAFSVNEISAVERALMSNKEKLTKTFVNILKQSFTEGSEEIATDIANELCDQFINTYKSGGNMEIRRLMENGMTSEEAMKEVMLDFVVNTAVDGLAGSVSGGAFGFGGTALQSIYGKAHASEIQQIIADNGLIEKAKELAAASQVVSNFISGKASSEEEIAAFLKIKDVKGTKGLSLKELFEDATKATLPDSEESIRNLLSQEQENTTAYETVSNAYGANIQQSATETAVNTAEQEAYAPEVVNQEVSTDNPTAQAYAANTDTQTSNYTPSPVSENASEDIRTEQALQDVNDFVADVNTTTKYNSTSTTIPANSGDLTYNAVSINSVKDKQTANEMNAVKKVAEYFDNDVVFYTGQININGKTVDSNGFNLNGKLYVNLDNGNSMQWVIGHEIAHNVFSYAADEKASAGMKSAQNAFTSELVTYGYNGDQDAYNTDMAQKVDELKASGAYSDMTDEQITAKAQEEVFCDHIGNFFEKTSDLKTLKADIEKNPTKWQKFLTALKNIIARIKAKVKDMGTGTHYNAKTEKLIENMEKARQNIATLLREYKKSPVGSIMSAKKGTLDFNLTFMGGKGEGGDYDSFVNDISKVLVENKIMTQAEVDETVRTINIAIDFASKYGFLDVDPGTAAKERAFLPIKQNSDPHYKYSLDYSTLCRKRIFLQTVIDAVENKIGLLTTEENAIIRKAVAEERAAGIEANRANMSEEMKDLVDTRKALKIAYEQVEIACVACYVESTRQKTLRFQNLFLESKESMEEGFRNRIAMSEMSKEEKAKLKAKYEAMCKKEFGKDVSASKLKEYRAHEMKKYRIEKFKISEHNARVMELATQIDKMDFRRAEGLRNIRMGKALINGKTMLENGLTKTDCKNIYVWYKTTISSQSRAKSMEADVGYKIGDSKKLTKKLIAKLNKEFGVRVHSWSDAEAKHILDYIASTIDMSVRGAKMLAYTKVSWYVRFMGKTNQMINMSFFPAGVSVKDGKLVLEKHESFDFDEALKLRDEFADTAGIVIVGTDDNQIMIAMQTDYIDYIIPYHTSGMTKEMMHILQFDNWQTNFEEEQTDRKMSEKQIAEAMASNTISSEWKPDISDSHWGKEVLISEWFDPIAKKYKGQKKSGNEIMQEAQQNYFNLCLKRGLIPRYNSHFLEYSDGRYTTKQGYENYWKVLVERKMINNKTGEIIIQKPVTPVFDSKVVESILQNEVDNYPAKKAAEDAIRDSVVETTSKVLKQHRDSVLSEKGLTEEDSDGNTFENTIDFDTFDNLMEAIYQESQTRDKVEASKKDVNLSVGNTRDTEARKYLDRATDAKAKNKGDVNFSVGNRKGGNQQRLGIQASEEATPEITYDERKNFTMQMIDYGNRVAEAETRKLRAKYEETLKGKRLAERKSRALTKSLDAARKQLQLSSKHEMNRNKFNAAVKDLSRQLNITEKSLQKSFASDIEDIYNKIANDKEITNSTLNEMLDETVGRIISDYSASLNPDRAKALQQARHILRGLGLSEKSRAELKHAFDKEGMRLNKNFGTHLAKNGEKSTSVDALIGGEPELIQTLFSGDEIDDFTSRYGYDGRVNLSDYDILVRIADLVADPDSVYDYMSEAEWENNFGMPIESVKQEIKSEILQAYYTIPEAKTAADKQQQRIIEERLKFHEEIENLNSALEQEREFYKNRIKKIRADADTKAKTDMAKARAKYQSDIAEAKQKGKAAVESEKQKGKAAVKEATRQELNTKEMTDLIRQREVLVDALTKTTLSEDEVTSVSQYKNLIESWKKSIIAYDNAYRIMDNYKNTGETDDGVSNRDYSSILRALSKEVTKASERMNYYNTKLAKTEGTRLFTDMRKKLNANKPKAFTNKTGRAIANLKAENTKIKDSIKLKKIDDERKSEISYIEKTAAKLGKWLDSAKPKKGEYVHYDLQQAVYNFLVAVSDDKLHNQHQCVKKLVTVQKIVSDLKSQGRMSDAEFSPAVQAAITNYIENLSETTTEALSLAQLKGLSNLCTIVLSEVRNANTMLASRQKEQVTIVANKTIAEVNKYGLARDGGKNNLVKEHLAYDSILPINIFDRLGEEGRKIFWELSDAQTKYFAYARKIEEYTNGLSDKYKSVVKDIRNGKSYRVEFTVKGEKVGIQMDVGELMSIYLTGLREAGARHIIGKYAGGIKLTQERLTKAMKDRINNKDEIRKISEVGAFSLTGEEYNAICNNLSDNEKAFADEISRFMSVDVAGWGNETTLTRWGIPLFTDKSYIPLVSASEFLKGNEDEKKKNEKGSVYALDNQSFTKELNPFANNPVLISDLFSVFLKHSFDMANYASFSIPINDINKVLSYQYKEEVGGKTNVVSFKDVISKRLGKGEINYIENLIKDISKEKSSESTANILNKLLTRSKAAAVAGNLSVVAQQYFAITKAAYTLSLKALGISLTKNLNPIEIKNNIKEGIEHNTLFWWKDKGYFETDISAPMEQKLNTRSVTAGEKIGNAFTAIQDVTMKPAGWMDNLAWGVIWGAAKQKVESQNKGITKGSDAYWEKVNRVFNETIYRTQVVDSTLTRTQISRGKDTAVKMLASFMNEPMSAYSMVANNAYMIAKTTDKADKAKYRKQLAKAGVVYISTQAVNAIVRGLIAGLRDKDKDKDYLQRVGVNALAEFLPDLLFFGNTPYGNAILSTFQGFTNSNLALDGIDKIYSAFAAVKSMMDKLISGDDIDSNDVYSTVYAAAQMLSYMTGVPIGNILRDVYSVGNEISNGIAGVTWGISNTKYISTHTQAMYDAYANGDMANYEKEKGIVKKLMMEGGRTEQQAERDMESRIKTLMKQDKNIIEAAHLIQSGNAYAAQDIIVAMQGKGFDEQDINDAVEAVLSSYKSSVKSVNTYLASGETEQAEKLIQSLIRQGFDESHIREDVEAGKEQAQIDYLANTEEVQKAVVQMVNGDKSAAEKAINALAAQGYESAAVTKAVSKVESAYNSKVKEAAELYISGRTAEGDAVINSLVDSGYNRSTVDASLAKAKGSVKEEAAYKYAKSFESGVSEGTVANANHFLANITTEETSKREQVRDYVLKLSLSDAQKQVLYDDMLGRTESQNNGDIVQYGKAEKALSSYAPYMGLADEDKKAVLDDVSRYYTDDTPPASKAYAVKAGLDLAQFAAVEKRISREVADKDSEGKSISGSKKAKVLADIKKTGWSAAKQAFYYLYTQSPSKADLSQYGTAAYNYIAKLSVSTAEKKVLLAKCNLLDVSDKERKQILDKAGF